MQKLFIGNQKTIKEKIGLSGLTIEGSKTTVNLHPFDQGIIFKKGRAEYPVTPGIISVKKNRVFIGPIGMIEHLLAVLAGLGIDNIMIEVDGKELPIFDGSAQGYYDAITDTGIYDLKKPRRFFRFREMIHGTNHSFIRSKEGSNLDIEFEYDPGHPMIKKRSLKFFSIKELITARTFAFVKADDPRIRDYRFGLGITDDGFYPDLRHPDEPIRHKLLDLLGDLYTLGRPFYGQIQARNPSHRLNIAFVKQQVP